MKTWYFLDGGYAIYHKYVRDILTLENIQRSQNLMVKLEHWEQRKEIRKISWRERKGLTNRVLQDIVEDTKPGWSKAPYCIPSYIYIYIYSRLRSPPKMMWELSSPFQTDPGLTNVFNNLQLLYLWDLPYHLLWGHAFPISLSHPL